MNSEFTNKLNRLRQLLSEHTSAQMQEMQEGPPLDPTDDGSKCPIPELGACCQAFGCVDGSMRSDCENANGTFHLGASCSDNPCGSMQKDRVTDVSSLLRDYIIEESDGGENEFPAEPMMPMG
jgi:hypothetical protein